MSKTYIPIGTCKTMRPQTKNTTLGKLSNFQSADFQLKINKSWRKFPTRVQFCLNAERDA